MANATRPLAYLLGMTLISTAGFASNVGANEYAPQLTKVLMEKVQPWISDPEVIAAVRAQNSEHASLDQAAIDELDQKWRAEADAGGGPFIAKIMGRALSKHLLQKKSADPELFTEIFIMDNRGLNVGQSDVTSDYWQGDEAKWQKTYGSGADSVFIDDIEFDDSSEMFQAQVSADIIDPDSGEAIGAVTFGVNVENLE